MNEQHTAKEDLFMDAQHTAKEDLFMDAQHTAKEDLFMDAQHTAKEVRITQGSDEWHEFRHGKITGTSIESAVGASYSSAKKIWILGGFVWKLDEEGSLNIDGEATDAQKKASAKKQTTLAMEIAGKRMSTLEIDDFQTDAMARGHELEPLSVKAAEKRHGVKFESYGEQDSIVLQSNSFPDFGFSPDAIYRGKSGEITGGYETKSKSEKAHIEYMLKGVVPSEHLMQCLCPMIMDDRVKFWMFGHFDDRNNVNNLFTKTILAKDYSEFIFHCRKEIRSFNNLVERIIEDFKNG